MRVTFEELAAKGVGGELLGGELGVAREPDRNWIKNPLGTLGAHWELSTHPPGSLFLSPIAPNVSRDASCVSGVDEIRSFIAGNVRHSRPFVVMEEQFQAQGDRPWHLDARSRAT